MVIVESNEDKVQAIVPPPDRVTQEATYWDVTVDVRCYASVYCDDPTTAQETVAAEIQEAFKALLQPYNDPDADGSANYRGLPNIKKREILSVGTTKRTKRS